MNTNTHPHAAAAIASRAATTRVLTHEVTPADVAAVLQRNAVQVANTDGMPFSVMAERMFDDLDFSRIERAALLAGADSVAQALAMRDVVADQLVEKGILKRKLTIIERLKADHRANMAAELGCPILVDLLAIPDLLPILQEARAWFSTSGPIATRLDAVISEVIQAQGGKQQSIRNALLRKALASFGSTGDTTPTRPSVLLPSRLRRTSACWRRCSVRTPANCSQQCCSPTIPQSVKYACRSMVRSIGTAQANSTSQRNRGLWRYRAVRRST